MGSFSEECARLALLMDPKLYDEREWVAENSKTLDSFVSKAVQAFQREGRFLLEPGERQNRVILAELKLQGGDNEAIMALRFKVERGVGEMYPMNPDGSAVSSHGKTFFAQVDEIDDDWVEKKLAAILLLIQ